ncbi:MAG: DNA cytosine methyltransferase [Defluviitaleaceae bacterium]|nr:DNA cytosine methyltransferase [Defluviitaleaceae bacterium]
MRTLDLFCGCGGLSLGFQTAGFQIHSAFDAWDKAIEIYNKNFNHSAELLDLSTISHSYFSELRPDIIIGGPPCQDYSSAGKRDESNGRADLTITFAELVCGVSPKWFVMENVDRITKSDTLQKAINIFKRSGYGLTQVVLDASKCGVPQKRKRFFMIGELHGEDDFLQNALISNLSDTSMTIYDYLGDELNTKYYYRHPRSYARRGIFGIDEPSPTIRGVNRPIPSTYKVHDGDATHDLSQVRVLTTEERARLQTFPVDFKFEGTKTDLEQIIGNAVPVNLARYVARCLFEYIRRCENHETI